MEKKLAEYNRKRNFQNTKEPLGKVEKTSQKRRFCIQHHLARKDHYDLRLEWDGTLKSWAVPKGPSYNPNDKRLAVRVEDHPLAYRNFEGIIPKGEYGGGTVQLWDRGTYEITEMSNAMFDGPLKLVFHGKRLKGNWTLVPFKEDNWLLIKEQDEYVNHYDITKFVTSIKTGRTVEEITNKVKKEKITLTHPEKIIFEKEGVTKKQIFNYYEKVSKKMFPYLEDRLLSTLRSPDGNEKTKFFKKHFEKTNPGMQYLKIDNEDEEYAAISNINGILYEVQMNGYEFHIWGSKVTSLEYPDMMVFDLDPDEKLSLKKVRQGVKDLKEILDSLSLTSFLKTSGGKGYHIVVPITSIKSWEEFRAIAKNIAKLMSTKWPNRYVSTMSKEARKGKIFIDWVRNTRGSSFVAPYSVRLRKKPTVSMPIFWEDLDSIKPDGVTIDKALKMIKQKNPWQNFWKVKQ